MDYYIIHKKKRETFFKLAQYKFNIDIIKYNSKTINSYRLLLRICMNRFLKTKFICKVDYLILSKNFSKLIVN
jgi:transposase